MYYHNLKVESESLKMMDGQTIGDTKNVLESPTSVVI